MYASRKQIWEAIQAVILAITSSFQQALSDLGMSGDLGVGHLDFNYTVHN